MTETSLVIGISVADKATPSSAAIIRQIEMHTHCSALVIEDHAAHNAEADAAQMQALILMGNDLDIDPEDYIHHYGAGDPRAMVHPATHSERQSPRASARAAYEKYLLDLAMAARMPLLGICGGMQRINVSLGGTLIQHLPDLVGDDRHCQRTRGVDPHVADIPILIEPCTTLAEIACDLQTPYVNDASAAEPKVIYENSIHHQAVDDIAPGLRRCCVTDVMCQDTGNTSYIIKGIEADPNGIYAEQFIMGVQWHPEFCASDMGPSLVQRLILEATTS